MWCPESPPALEMKIVRDVGSLDSTWSRVAPPPPNEHLARLKDFGFELVLSTSKANLPIPPHCENENLVRLRDFGFELVQSTPKAPYLSLRENENLARLKVFGFDLVQREYSPQNEILA